MVKLFNIDLHISVIKDLEYILKDLYADKIDITNWSMSGHSWVFNEPSVQPKIINAYTWKNINVDKIKEFVDHYYDFLSTFDGFIVTHSPVFCLLYETFNKPIILINSCRYEQPFSWNDNIDMWNYLNIKLKKMFDKKQLIAVSNNKADAKYLKTGTGIESKIIPSLCLYTNSKYTPTQNKFILNNGNCIPEDENIIHKSTRLKDGYSWQQLYHYKGIIHMPYDVSTMSIFEQYSANIPLFFPSKAYLIQLIKNNGYQLLSRYNKMNGGHTYHPNLHKCLHDDEWIEFWINNADYYDEENMKHLVYFDHNDHLHELLLNVDTNVISKQMQEHNSVRKQNVYTCWKNIFDVCFQHLLSN